MSLVILYKPSQFERAFRLLDPWYFQQLFSKQNLQLKIVYVGLSDCTSWLATFGSPPSVLVHFLFIHQQDRGPKLRLPSK